MKDLTIKKKMNGFAVEIGCQELVFESKRKMLDELGRYIDDPEAVEKEYTDKYGSCRNRINTQLGSLTSAISGDWGLR